LYGWLYEYLYRTHFAHSIKLPSYSASGAADGGGIALQSGGGAQGQGEGDRPAGGGRPETAGQPDQTQRDDQLPDHTAGAAAQQQDCHPQGTNRTPSADFCFELDKDILNNCRILIEYEKKIPLGD